MQKLTKEQASSLYATLVKNVICYDDRSMLWIKTVKDILDQHTEKEFPKFNGSWSCPNGGGSVELHKSIGNTYIFIYQDGKYVLSWQPHEFKQFTVGCNKIVEWLEEQE